MRKAMDASGQALWLFGKALPAIAADSVDALQPDWQQARIRHIDQVLQRVRKLPSGGWYVAAATRRLSRNPHFLYIDGHEICLWKSDGKVSAAINSCPHMGAPLSEGKVRDGVLTCFWHGMQISAGGKQGEFLDTHDDGVLTWVRFGSREGAVHPTLPVRPERFIEGVIQFVARCDPEDVIANRLDPWHGVHFHPHSFAKLKVISNADDVLTVRVVFRAVGPFGIEVDCTFHCPEPNTIVMTIIDGEGTGSVVETHATPLRPGWTTVTEATLATSDRAVFRRAIKRPGRVRSRIEQSARRLWAEDRAYAERRYFLRHPELLPDLAAESLNTPVGKPRPL